MIHFSYLVTKYDKLERQYETMLMNCINLTMNKANALDTIGSTQLESDNVAAKNLFAKNPTSKIRSLDNQRAQLTAGAKILHSWMTETLNELFLYNSRRLLAPDIEVLITKRIRISNVKKLKDSWWSLSSWMRKQLKDMSPRYMFKSLTSMARPLLCQSYSGRTRL